MQFWENFEHKLDSSYWQAKEVFLQAIRRLRDKRSHTARFVKDHDCALFSDEEDIRGGFQKLYFKSILKRAFKNSSESSHFTAGFFEKRFRECCGSTMLTAACYWL